MPKELPIGVKFRPTLLEMATYFLKYKALNVFMKARTIPEECIDIFSRHLRDLPDYGREEHFYYYSRKLAEVTTNSYSLWKLTGEVTDVLDPKNNNELVGIKHSYSFIENEEESDSEESDSEESNSEDLSKEEEEEAPKYNWFMDVVSLPKTVVDTDWILCHIYCKIIKPEIVNLPSVESESDHGEEEEDAEKVNKHGESLDVVKEKDDKNVNPPPSPTP